MRFELDFPVIQDQYQTSPRKLSWIARKFPSLTFYKKMFGVVKRAARLAKQGKYGDPEWCLSSYEILRALESVGTQAIIEKIQSVTKQSGPSIIIGNHMSALETFLLPYLICPHMKLTFVVKEALISYPVFKHVMLSRNPVVIARSNPKQDFLTVLKEGTKRVEEGYSILVFPQTTRMLRFDRSQFNSIGVKLAKRARVPVVPLALKTDCWGNGTLLKDFGKIDPSRSIRIKFGSPMEIVGNGKAQQELIVSHIENCLNQWNSNTTDS
ncbi:MAG: lysophospholipid acyltransferase family protein [Verrucomicrobia bacterium]|nr:lysophospholipid acyltransferase family protein [Verrucomicrobiota bacterium]